MPSGYSIAQNDISVKRDFNNRNELLELADAALAQAQRFREKWLAGGDPQAWRLWRACLADRDALLGEVNYVT